MVKKTLPRGKVGSAFAEFLTEENIYEEAESHAIKRVLAWQIANEMAAQGISKARMASLMKTSRSQLDRLLDPTHENVLLGTVQRAASAVGKRITFVLEDAAPPSSRI